ncbi:unnamed protein product [Rhodiola kirilowii]
MANTGEGEGEGITASPSSSSAGGRGSRRVRTRGDPFLIVCRCFSVITALTALLCIAANVLSAIRSFKNGSDVFDGIFRCYAVVICSFVVVAETEWSFILKFWKLLEYWPGRGMLQIFVAVMTRAFPDTSGEHKELVFFQNLAAYMLLGCGVLYVISGILCIGFLKRARQKDEITRGQAAKDLEELERRRGELEALLIQETA